MYRVNCTINEKQYYFFLDKNGIIYKQLSVDTEKELLDFSVIIEQYQLENPQFSLVYYKDQNLNFSRTFLNFLILAD
jgi:hypothetical protein